jgi:hypothetical protein
MSDSDSLFPRCLKIIISLLDSIQNISQKMLHHALQNRAKSYDL